MNSGAKSSFKLDHVAFYCSDFVAMKAFFITYFGMTADEEHVSLRSRQTNGFMSFPDGSTRLELMSYLPGMNPTADCGRLSHLSISVGSKVGVDDITSRLQSDGYEVISGPRITGDGYYGSNVKILEDLHLEITV